MDYDYQEKGNPIGVLVAVFAGLICFLFILVLPLIWLELWKQLLGMMGLLIR
jgi:hypothetical protein